MIRSLSRSRGSLRTSKLSANSLPPCPACSLLRSQHFSCFPSHPIASTSKAVYPWICSKSLFNSPTHTRRIATQPQDAVQNEEDRAEEIVSEPVSARTSEQIEMDALQPAIEEEEPLAPIPEPPLEPPIIPIPLHEPTRLSHLELLSPTIPSGPPTPADLASLRPKNFYIPDASTAESHRILYKKEWNAAQNRLLVAFAKTQLLALIKEMKLDKKLNEPIYKNSIKGKKTKNWTPKPVGKMSKVELAVVIQVLHWHMVDPAVLPAPNKGPQIAESFPLSDRTLFIILSPKSSVLTSLTRQLGVKLSFKRQPDDAAVQLVVRGNKESVAAAKDTLDNILDTVHQKDFVLPQPASTFRSEVYQTISRLGKTFLEAGADSKQLIATATELKYIEKTERLLNSAFTQNSVASLTPIYASVPTEEAFKSVSYALFPFISTQNFPFPASSAPSLARLQILSLKSDSSGVSDKHFAHLNWLDQSEQTRLSSLEQIAISSEYPETISSAVEAAIQAIRHSKDDPSQEIEITVRFGHVLWPAWSTPNSSADSGKTLLEGDWPFQRFLKWKGGFGKAAKPFFVPASSPSLNRSAMALNPIESLPAVSDILQGKVSEGGPFDGPDLSSRTFRRLTYRPTRLPEANGFEESIQVEFETRKIRKEKKIRQREIHVIVPNGLTDYQILISSSQPISVEPGQLHNFPEAVMSNPRGESTPLRLNISNSLNEPETFLLASDQRVRTTEIIPTTGDDLPHVRERWQERLDAYEKGYYHSVKLSTTDWQQQLKWVEKIANEKSSFDEEASGRNLF